MATNRDWRPPAYPSPRPADRASTLYDRWGSKVVQTLADGCMLQAALVESAWAEGNGAELGLSADNVRVFEEEELQATYRRSTFLPALSLEDMADPMP